MQCPKCETPMQVRPSGGARVDTCPRCQGAWFDQGELETVRRRKSGARRETPTVLVPERELAGLDCPRCEQVPMELFRAHAFQVERCPGCRGMFFDGDEMEQLLTHWRSKRRVNRRRQKVEARDDRNALMIAVVAGLVAGS